MAHVQHGAVVCDDVDVISLLARHGIADSSAAFGVGMTRFTGVPRDESTCLAQTMQTRADRRANTTTKQTTNSVHPTQLARQLRITDYFTLGWGTMVGVGWLVIMDDWLLRGCPLGTALGFLIGGSVLLPIGWVYGKLVIAMPDAAGEIAYTSAVFPRPVSFATGWMMTLAYFIVCPWEAVAVGRIAAYIFPALDSMEIYRIAGRPVFLPRLVIGMGLTALLTLLNYRGVRLSATFQNWTSFGTLALFVLFVGLGVTRGSRANFPPLFTHTSLISILLVIQIVPYFMTGFESVGKAAEEASS